MPRLFFAIRTSDVQRDELRHAQQTIAEQLDALGASYKLENLQDSHCTLRFLGNVAANYITRLIEHAEQEINTANVNPFDVALTSCGTFSHHGNTRVMWAGLSEAPQLLTLRNAVDSAASNCDISLDNSEGFHPHLTLIRFKEPFRLPNDFVPPAIKPITARVNNIELVESRTMPTGAAHEVIARFAL